MGIRFFCPHCQSRLNVKSSQAGHPGVCPDCNATLDVPSESILPGIPKSPSQRFYIEEKNPPAGSSQLIGFDSQDTIAGDLIGGSEVATSAVADPTDSLSPVFATSQDGGSGIFMLDRPSPSPDFGKVDPILAAPEKVWYFRNKEVGERGPLKSKIMQQHIDSGDVAAGSMVWREDWEDWAAAEDAFPQIDGPVDPVQSVQPNKNRPELSTDSTKKMVSKKVLFYGAMVTGLVVVVALTYVLLWILPS